MKYLMLIFLFLLALPKLKAQSKISEKDYSLYIQSLIGGEREVSIKNGRVDLVTNDFAFEIEKAPNWKESIGQSLWYALNTNKKPAIIIIIENKDQYKYLIQLQSTLNYGKLNDAITVYAFPQDFQDLIDKKKAESK